MIRRKYKRFKKKRHNKYKKSYMKYKNVSNKNFKENQYLISKYGYYNDTDNDGKLNYEDCYPFDYKRQDAYIAGKNSMNQSKLNPNIRNLVKNEKGLYQNPTNYQANLIDPQELINRTANNQSPNVIQMARNNPNKIRNVQNNIVQQQSIMQKENIKQMMNRKAQEQKTWMLHNAQSQAVMKNQWVTNRNNAYIPQFKKVAMSEEDARKINFRNVASDITTIPLEMGQRDLKTYAKYQTPGKKNQVWTDDDTQLFLDTGLLATTKIKTGAKVVEGYMGYEAVKSGYKTMRNPTSEGVAETVIYTGGASPLIINKKTGAYLERSNKGFEKQIRDLTKKEQYDSIWENREYKDKNGYTTKELNEKIIKDKQIKKDSEMWNSLDEPYRQSYKIETIPKEDIAKFKDEMKTEYSNERFNKDYRKNTKKYGSPKEVYEKNGYFDLQELKRTEELRQKEIDLELKARKIVLERMLKEGRNPKAYNQVTIDWLKNQVKMKLKNAENQRIEMKEIKPIETKKTIEEQRISNAIEKALERKEEPIEFEYENYKGKEDYKGYDSKINSKGKEIREYKFKEEPKSENVIETKSQGQQLLQKVEQEVKQIEEVKTELKQKVKTKQKLVEEEVEIQTQDSKFKTKQEQELVKVKQKERQLIKLRSELKQALKSGNLQKMNQILKQFQEINNNDKQKWKYNEKNPRPPIPPNEFHRKGKGTDIPIEKEEIIETNIRGKRSSEKGKGKVLLKQKEKGLVQGWQTVLINKNGKTNYGEIFSSKQEALNEAKIITDRNKGKQFTVRPVIVNPNEIIRKAKHQDIKSRFVQQNSNYMRSSAKAKQQNKVKKSSFNIYPYVFN